MPRLTETASTGVIVFGVGGRSSISMRTSPVTASTQEKSAPARCVARALGRKEWSRFRYSQGKDRSASSVELWNRATTVGWLDLMRTRNETLPRYEVRSSRVGCPTLRWLPAPVGTTIHPIHAVDRVRSSIQLRCSSSGVRVPLSLRLNRPAGAAFSFAVRRGACGVRQARGRRWWRCGRGCRTTARRAGCRASDRRRRRAARPRRLCNAP